MLPLTLLKTAQGHAVVGDPAGSPFPWDQSPADAALLTLQLIEVKTGETYNGHMLLCDSWMNVHLREVICTSKASVQRALCCSRCITGSGIYCVCLPQDGDRFWRMPEAYIRGNTIKYIRVPEEVRRGQ